MISDESLKQDLILLNRIKKTLYMLELADGFENNLKVNSTRNSEKYMLLIHTIQSTVTEATFINVSTSALGASGNACESSVSMLNDLNTAYNLGKVMSIHDIHAFESHKHFYAMLMLHILPTEQGLDRTCFDGPLNHIFA